MIQNTAGVLVLVAMGLITWGAWEVSPAGGKVVLGFCLCIIAVAMAKE
jgi:hypothetical protein